MERSKYCSSMGLEDLILVPAGGSIFFKKKALDTFMMVEDKILLSKSVHTSLTGRQCNCNLGLRSLL